MVKNQPCNAEDMGSNPGQGTRSPCANSTGYTPEPKRQTRSPYAVSKDPTTEHRSTGMTTPKAIK